MNLVSYFVLLFFLSLYVAILAFLLARRIRPIFRGKDAPQLSTVKSGRLHLPSFMYQRDDEWRGELPAPLALETLSGEVRS